MIKTLKKETIIYGVGRILGSSISFFLFPFYLYALQSTGEYGIVQIIIAFIAFANILFLFGFDAALMRYYAGEKKISNQKSYLTNTYFHLIISSSFLLLVLILLKSSLSIYLIADSGEDLIVKIGLILFFDALRSIHLLVLRAENKASYFIIIQVLDILLLTALNIYFVGYCQMGVAGVVQSNFLSSIIIFIITFPIIFTRFDFKLLSIQYWKKLKSFALPLMPAGLFWMILEFADRKMLEFLVPHDSLSIVGIYGSGYKLGALMLLLVYSFNYAWRPYFLKSKTIGDFQKISSYVFFGLGFFWIILVLYLDLIAKTTLPIINTSLINYIYWDGLLIVPIIALSYIFHASFVLQEAAPFLANQTYKISICRGVGVIINIILNLILIPYYGDKPYLGAAIATLISYFCMSLALYMWNYAESTFRYQYQPILIVFINIILAWYCSYLNNISIKVLIPGFYLLQFVYYFQCRKKQKI